MATRRTALTTRSAPSLLEDFDQIFRNFRTGLEDLFWTPTLAPGMSRSMASGTRQALMDLRDVGDAFLLEAELPGVPKDQVDIEVTEDGIQLRAELQREHEQQEGSYYLRERAYNAWYRRVPFPAEVVPDQAEATMENGILTVRVPKQEPTPQKKGKKLKVK